MPSATVDSVAHVYAKAIFQLAGGDGTASGAPTSRAALEEVADELEQIVELTRSDRRFREFIVSPIIDKQSRSTALRTILGGRVSDLTLRFLLVLNRKDRLGHIEGIQRAYDLLLQESFGQVEVDVYTAAPVAEAQLAIVKDLVKRALGKEPVLHRYVEPEMLGGIRLGIGDRLIDASVSGRLNRMRESILVQGAHALRSKLPQIMDER